jgi:MalT-like TPR region
MMSSLPSELIMREERPCLLSASSCNHSLSLYCSFASSSLRIPWDEPNVRRILSRNVGIRHEWWESTISYHGIRLLKWPAAHDSCKFIAELVAALVVRLQTAVTPEAALRLPSVLIFSARLALEVGDLQAANRILETPGLQEQTETRIFQARLSLAQGKPREALLQLERLLPAVQDCRQVIEIQVLLALAHAAHQEGHEARQWLQQALSQARAEGFVRIFLSEGESLVRLLRQLVPTIQERELRTYAQSVLRAFAQIDGEQTPGTSSSDVVNWVKHAKFLR